MDTRDYSGSPTGTPLPPHPVKEFTMLESLLQAISPQDPLTIFLTYTQDSTPLSLTRRIFTKPYDEILTTLNKNLHQTLWWNSYNFWTSIEELLYGCIKSISLSNEYNLMLRNLFGYEKYNQGFTKMEVWKFECKWYWIHIWENESCCNCCVLISLILKWFL